MIFYSIDNVQDFVRHGLMANWASYKYYKVYKTSYGYYSI